MAVWLAPFSASSSNLFSNSYRRVSSTAAYSPSARFRSSPSRSSRAAADRCCAITRSSAVCRSRMRSDSDVTSRSSSPRRLPLAAAMFD